MTFHDLAQSLAKIEATTKRLEITQLLSELYKRLSPDEIAPVSYLLQGKLVAKYISKEFQISVKMTMKILSRLLVLETNEDLGIASEKINSWYKKLGDLGTVAEEVAQKSKNEKPLSLTKVDQILHEIAEENGAGSQERKIEKAVALLEQLDPLSRKYVTRVLVGSMRLGFSDMTMIDAVSWAITGDKSLHAQIEEAFQKRADIGYIAKVILEKGVKELDYVKIALGTPIVPALCQRLNTAEEIIQKMTEVYAEPKYDGTRVQIHVQKTIEGYKVRTFTRNLEESSAQFPELLEAVKALKCDSCILDSEAIAFDKKTGQLLAFQQTISRKRKHGIEEQAAAVPLQFFVFDILEKDGESLIDTPLRARKEILKKFIPENHQLFKVSPYLHTADATELHDYHEEQLAQGLEGVVIKKVDSTYQSGRKAFAWVKIKESEGSRGKLSDTVDCVVMGYFLARGIRTSFKVGAILAGVLDKEGKIVTISKVGSGLSEELANEFIKRVSKFEVKEAPAEYEVHKNLTPDVWISPKVVIEVAADEITKSPLHTAGVALRFPRLVRFRDDKGWEQATTLKEIHSL